MKQKAFQVFQDGVRADTIGYSNLKKGLGWDCSIWTDLNDAIDYAHLWAYPIAKNDLPNFRREMKVGVPVDMSIGEIPVMMEIREVEF